MANYSPLPQLQTGATPPGQPSSGGYNDLGAFASNTATNRSALVDRLNTGLGGAYDQFANETGLNAIRDTLSTLKNNTFGVQNQLNMLPENVNARTKGSLVNDAMRQRQIAAESTPLQSNLAQLTLAQQPLLEAYTSANDTINRRMDILREQQSRELSGFDKGAELELSALQDKIQRGRELSDREWQKVFELEKMQKSFDMDMKKQSAGSAQSLENSKSLAQFNSDLERKNAEENARLLRESLGIGGPSTQQDYSQLGDGEQTNFVKNLFGGSMGSSSLSVRR